MSYIDEHIEWLRSKGVEVLPEFSEELHGEFRPEHDPESLKALPPDVALWHEARMCGRVSGEAIVGGHPVVTSIPFSSVIVLLRSFVTFGPPIAASICDLVPGFEIVTMDYGPGGRG